MQWLRRLSQTAFFMLFILAPPLDLLRFDLLEGHLLLLGEPWQLAIDPSSDPVQLAQNILLYLIMPLLLLLLFGGWVAWRYGRLYCGWLCPHFTVVEGINQLFRRATGRLSLWDRHPLPNQQCDGTISTPQRYYQPLTLLVVVAMAALWAVVLLTYLLPPTLIYTNLIHFELSANQGRFIGVATLLFTLDFLFARHLFCRFGCAVGVAQSLIWMANRSGMVVGFNRDRASVCQSCDYSCEHACPMRLKPRTSKRAMFTCTQCGRCIESCQQVQQQVGHSAPPLLSWVQGAAAQAVARNAGVFTPHRPPINPSTPPLEPPPP